eukprot:10695842-Ditylum_brightwellii.AAC.1
MLLETNAISDIYIKVIDSVATLSLGALDLKEDPQLSVIWAKLVVRVKRKDILLFAAYMRDQCQMYIA